MKIKYLLILTIIFAGFFSAMAQPNYRQAAQDTTANYYQIVADFEAWIDTVQLPDSVKTREIKKFGRWASYWETRVQYSDQNLNGTFTPYQLAMGAAWINPSCTGPDASNWENIGPYPADLHDMGFIQSVWVNPINTNMLIVGSGRYAGLLKTTDFGQTWKDVLAPYRFPVLGIPYISASPILEQNGKRTIYAATGSDEVGFSIGIIKSEDDGETWEILNNFPLFANQEYNFVVRKILAAPVRTSNTNPDIIYAIARNIFFKSLDGGVTWTSKTIEFNHEDFEGTLDDIEIDPFNNNVIAISGLPSSGGAPAIWITTNGGDDFTEILSNSGYVNLNNVRKIQIDFPTSGRLYMLTREPNKVGRVFYYDFSQTPPAWNFTNTHNYYATGAPPGIEQFNRVFKVTANYQNFYIGTENLSIANPNSNAVIIPGSIFPYNTTANTHADIRCIEVIQNEIWLGTDGGLTYSPDHGASWISLNGRGKNGITNNEIIGFDITQGFEKRIVAGLIDNSFKMSIDNKWYSSTPLHRKMMLTTTGSQWVDDWPEGLGDVGHCIFTPASKDWLWILGLVPFKTTRINNEFICYYTDILKNPFGHWWIIPLAMNNKQPNEIFYGCSTGKVLLIYDYDVTNLNTIQGWAWAQLPNTTNDVNNIVIAPSNPDIMYATTLHATYGSVCEQAVYRSIDGGNNWIDITGVNPNSSVRNQNYSVTGIAVDWNNPNKVWVCLGGVSFDNNTHLPTPENRVFRTDDASANPVIWVDMTGGPNGKLPPLPATAIVNQPGTSRVFLASDGGIFYCDDNDPDWNCFSNGLPITRITNLRIDHITNELYASTYGYGIWKTALPCDVAQQSFVIDQNTGNVTWSNTTFSAGDIIVKSGYKLTIDDHTRIFMDPNTSILVEKGAELVVDNATLTACEEMWQGIRLWEPTHFLRTPPTREKLP